MTYEKLIREMDEKLQFPGLTNTWTMPVQNRLDMELTGIKTPVGLKIQGPNVEGIQQAGAQLQQVLGGIPKLRSVFAERVAEGFYINVEVNRPEAARYGLDCGRRSTSSVLQESAARISLRTWKAGSAIRSMFATAVIFVTMSSNCNRS